MVRTAGNSKTAGGRRTAALHHCLAQSVPLGLGQTVPKGRPGPYHPLPVAGPEKSRPQAAAPDRAPAAAPCATLLAFGIAPRQPRNKTPGKARKSIVTKRLAPENRPDAISPYKTASS